jgi:FkbM family methyltransferase
VVTGEAPAAGRTAEAEEERLMWISEALVQQLDNPGGREELARQANILLRSLFPHTDIEIFWDGMWIRRVNDLYFPDPEMFKADEKKRLCWPDLGGKFLRDADDYWFYSYKPAPGDVIIDVGAGRGEDIFAFSKSVGPAGRVWAIEPHPVSYEVLDRFCALNHLDNVTRLRYACVAEPGQLQIETLPVWESNYVRTGAAAATSSPVEGVRLDDLCTLHGIGGVDFLKMNIEGAEREALRGAAELLGRVRHVCIAAHDFRAARGEGDHFRTLAFVRMFLEDAGFQTITRDEDPRYYVPYHVHGFR